jgi:hypothetical protein
MLPWIQSSLEKLRNCLKLSIHGSYIQEYTLLKGLEIVQQVQSVYLYASASLETKHTNSGNESAGAATSGELFFRFAD